VAMPPPLIQAPGPSVPAVAPAGIVPPAGGIVPPAGGIVPPVVPPPPAGGIVPPVVRPPPPAGALLPPGTVALLNNALIRYLHPSTGQINYPYRIMLVEIDPLRIGGKIVDARGVLRYPWRVIPPVAPGEAYPAGYRETESVLTAPTTAALLMSIVGNFPTNRNRVIREIYGQTAIFLDNVSQDCQNIQITNELTFFHWLSRLPGLDHCVPTRVQVVRARGGGRPETPLPGARAHTFIDPAPLNDPSPL
jgi:hypothetical protein